MKSKQNSLDSQYSNYSRVFVIEEKKKNYLNSFTSNYSSDVLNSDVLNLGNQNKIPLIPNIPIILGSL